MQVTYEIYEVNGFCDSEWGHLGEVQAESIADVFPQVKKRWPDYPCTLLVARTFNAVLPLDSIVAGKAATEV